MVQLLAIALFLVMFWGVMPLLSAGMQRIGWPEKTRQLVTLAAWPLALAVGWLLLRSL